MHASSSENIRKLFVQVFFHKLSEVDICGNSITNRCMCSKLMPLGAFVCVQSSSAVNSVCKADCQFRGVWV